MAEAYDDVVRVQVHPGGVDAEELAELTALLREELLELDVAAAEPLTAEQLPDGSKGGAAALGGWLVVHFGPAGLRALVKTVAAWAGRTGKTVELTIGDDSLKLTGVTADVQSRIVDEFFARRGPST